MVPWGGRRDTLTSSHPRAAVPLLSVVLLQVAGTEAQERALHVFTECRPTHRQHELTLVHVNALPARGRGLEALVTEAAEGALGVVAEAMAPTHSVIGTLIYVNAVSSRGHVEARRAAQNTAVGARAVLTPPGPTHGCAVVLTLVNIHTLPVLWGGLEASFTQTVEGALSVDTAPSQTPVFDCTLVHIQAAGASLCAGKAGCAETEKGPLAVEALAMGCAVLVSHTLVHILTHGAIDQLETLGAEALVGASHVFALASQAAALEVSTLIHIFTGVAQGAGPVALVTIPAGEGASSVGADS